jgi:hypothetical protein
MDEEEKAEALVCTIIAAGMVGFLFLAWWNY